MERRNFLRAMLGVAAATALPSEVWPFRKIFIPAAQRIEWPVVLDYYIVDYPFLRWPLPSRLMTLEEAKPLVESFNQKVLQDKQAKGEGLNWADFASVSKPMFPDIRGTYSK